MSRLKIAVLISGRGSNLRALMEACAEPDFPAEIVLVLSNNPDAGGLGHAREAGLAARVVNHRDYADKPAFEQAMEAELTQSGAGLVCLAGFMRLLTPEFVERWRDRLINIHPLAVAGLQGAGYPPARPGGRHAHFRLHGAFRARRHG